MLGSNSLLKTIVPEIPDPTILFSNDFERELEVRRRLRDDFPFYAAEALKIRPKEGPLCPLVLNTAQQYLHQRIEEQKANLGMVRVLIVKGRQQGISTYVGGRFYHITTHNQGYRTFILTHEQDATANLFDMVQRYHENNFEELKPYTAKSNAKELVFSHLDSGYRVGTAGTKGKGRSSTVQLFHGSEVAFWPHANEHAAGIGNTVPPVPGTEVFLESTGNGIGNYFHRQWVKAIAGMSDYIAVFIPWYWQQEYRKEPPPGFMLDPEDLEYQQLYNLDIQQMAWRRAKILELEDPLLFKQEYPATHQEAFQITGTESFIKPEDVLKARKRPEGRSFGALVAGFDPARDGEDRDTFIYRQAQNAFGLKYENFNTFPERLAFCRSILRSHSPWVDMLFIDYGGGGYELGGMLAEDGYGHRVRVINFGSEAMQKHLYVNKRSEMYGECRAWLTDKDLPPSIPDDDALQGDLTACGFSYDSNTRYKLERKVEVKKRGLPSPDGADALVLTFAEPVFARDRVMGGDDYKVETEEELYSR